MEGEREPSKVEVDRSEGFGERLLGMLLDRAHEMPPRLIAPLVAEEVARIGGRNLSILLQDYEQMLLVPLPGRRLTVGDPEPIEDSYAGTAFLNRTTVEVSQDGSVRMYLPLLDGSAQIGAMVVTLDSIDDNDRRLLRRLAGLVAEKMIVTKDAYADEFFQARRRAPMNVAAEIQWSLLPPAVDDRPAGRGGRNSGTRLRRGRRQLRLGPQRRHPARGRDRRDGPRSGRRDHGDRGHRRLSPHPTRQHRSVPGVRVHGQSHQRAVRA
jgi:hypothetical protein